MGASAGLDRAKLSSSSGTHAPSRCMEFTGSASRGRWTHLAVHQTMIALTDRDAVRRTCSVSAPAFPISHHDNSPRARGACFVGRLRDSDLPNCHEMSARDALFRPNLRSWLGPARGRLRRSVCGPCLRRCSKLSLKPLPYRSSLQISTALVVIASTCRRFALVQSGSHTHTLRSDGTHKILRTPA